VTPLVLDARLRARTARAWLLRGNPCSVDAQARILVLLRKAATELRDRRRIAKVLAVLDRWTKQGSHARLRERTGYQIDAVLLRRLHDAVNAEQTNIYGDVAKVQP
jgi:hypothetical protein